MHVHLQLADGLLHGAMHACAVRHSGLWRLAPWPAGRNLTLQQQQKRLPYEMHLLGIQQSHPPAAK
jgi:hypothetical protein